MSVIRIIRPGDLALDTGGSPFLLDGIQYIRQKLSARFRFFLGEWFLDLRQGVPYYRDVFVANPNLIAIRALYRRIVIRTPGVLALRRFAILYDPAARTLRCDFEALCDGGVVVVAPEDKDFIVDLSLAVGSAPTALPFALAS